MPKILKSGAAAVLGLAMVLGITLTSSSPAQAVPRVQIHEIYYNSPGPDTGSNTSLNGEWVRLHNTTGTRISLTGWTLRDAQNHVYRFGTYTLGAYGYVTVHTGRGTNTQANRYWGLRWYVWNNTGDTATLKNSSGASMAQCSYGRSTASYKIC